MVDEVVGISMGFLPLHDLFYCGGVGRDSCETNGLTRASVAVVLAATWTGATTVCTFIGTRSTNPPDDSR